ncbi:family 20 glycosylhydrolase [Carboxylicivirga sediminis]|uniref:beta-N-acetylhexosaminidase n=1 Tax=Carboxylicivirga sediminis TaxID=2006564 RepID=A0A941F743_9BACT|nr:glycoside hydrolase family 20 protein [Carboxylicivirga sediminis]MBR8537817.1 family 20 glycosylhydrolase [Carboxylicivirga sediminis]
MIQLRTLVPFLIILLTAGCHQKETISPSVIPEPLHVALSGNSSFLIKPSTPVVIEDSSMLPAVTLLSEISHIDFNLSFGDPKGTSHPAIVLAFDHRLDSLSQEGYVLDINQQTLTIKAAGPQGLFYAVETIRQLLPADVANSGSELALPAGHIIDRPRFEWRGMHLDVSRHFMPTAFIKKYIDYLAMHKLNVFHWHLVDGIGWRIEIKSHPELTDIGAWRKVKPNLQPWQEFEVWRDGDEAPKYGGYYTQDEIREIVAYAAERFITVVPEIELPGHSEVVFQCYPHLCCKDATGKFIKNSGVYCASNPAAYQLLEDVLDEVIELFPSNYIHIGGDEVSKTNWNNCPDCQQLMQRKAYDAYELQSHFINHFDTYLKSKGRQLIGWHEILEGELSPTATVMYWGAETGVTDCLKEGHPTVLTTGSHLYFDHYQSLSKQEPKAFGGYAPLKKVYDYEPVPDGLDQKHLNQLLGVQANIWTEYMPNEKHVEYMLFPRIAALSEVAWQKKGTKNWEHFRYKMNQMLKHYEAMDINYAYSALRPTVQVELLNAQQLKVSLSTELEADIYYTTDGTEPNSESATLYKQPFMLSESATIKTIAYKDGQATGKAESREAILHKAAGAEVTLHSAPEAKYASNGPATLTDTDFGGDKWGNGKWLGILDKDFEASIQLSEPKQINSLKLSCIEENGAGIFYPSSIEVSVSDNGEDYKPVGTWDNKVNYQPPWSSAVSNTQFPVTFEPLTTQFIRVKASYPKIKGMGVFLFIDEVVIE